MRFLVSGDVAKKYASQSCSFYPSARLVQKYGIIIVGKKQIRYGYFEKEEQR